MRFENAVWLRERSIISMSRNLVLLIIFLVIVIAAMFFLASMDVEQEPKPVEKPVVGAELS